MFPLTCFFLPNLAPRKGIIFGTMTAVFGSGTILGTTNESHGECTVGVLKRISSSHVKCRQCRLSVVLAWTRRAVHGACDLLPRLARGVPMHQHVALSVGQHVGR